MRPRPCAKSCQPVYRLLNRISWYTDRGDGRRERRGLPRPRDHAGQFPASISILARNATVSEATSVHETFFESQHLFSPVSSLPFVSRFVLCQFDSPAHSQHAERRPLPLCALAVPPGRTFAPLPRMCGDAARFTDLLYSSWRSPWWTRILTSPRSWYAFNMPHSFFGSHH
jgi:hypothetical protein